MAEMEGEEATVSLAEFVQENNDLEEEALAVLGASDDQHCTYPQGPVPRQALYACASCLPPVPGGPVAGVCLACSLHCHDGHELYELYTKRFFRCDCGNSKFGDVKCQLCPEKAATNAENLYNHNFQGLYCSCNRPYPDPEDTTDDDMLQCIVCEDWFHERHLGSSVPTDKQYSEMICDACMSRCPFLQYYTITFQLVPDIPAIDQEKATTFEAAPSDQKDAKTSSQSMKTEGLSSACTLPSDPSTTDASLPTEKGVEKTADSGLPSERQPECSAPASSSADKEPNTRDEPARSGNDEGCALKKRKESCRSSEKLPVAGFFADGWRSELCLCTFCTAMYMKLGVSYLSDTSDSCEAYEARGRELSTCMSSVEKGMKAVEGQFNRVQQVEMFSAYNDMKQAFVAFMRPFAAQGKVVSEADVRHFFDQMRDRKRRDGGVSGMPPAHCH